MRRALVVNCSAPHYNLGAAKLARWLTADQGYTVTECAGDPGAFAFGHDLVCLSVIFSWHAPLARDIALRVRYNADVWCGGPGMTALANWWKRETDGDATLGIDWRFERQRVSGPYTFASRGCPVGCWFCPVTKLEGRTFTLDWTFQPAPVLCDNNLSALPDEFQWFIIARYAAAGIRLLDCNSGFEPHAFHEDTYERWRGRFAGAWRFAFDEWNECAAVQKMLWILRHESPRKKSVYVLTGNESIAACYARAMHVIELGGEPHCQFFKPLNWLGDPALIDPRKDWTYQLGRDFCRYFNTKGWRTYPISEYKPRVNEPPPFARILGGAA